MAYSSIATLHYYPADHHFASQSWGTSATVQRRGFFPVQIAAEYDLTEALVDKALAFYNTHRHEIDAAIAAAVRAPGV